MWGFRGAVLRVLRVVCVVRVVRRVPGAQRYSLVTAAMATDGGGEPWTEVLSSADLLGIILAEDNRKPVWWPYIHTT